MHVCRKERKGDFHMSFFCSRVCNGFENDNNHLLSFKYFVMIFKNKNYERELFSNYLLQHFCSRTYLLASKWDVRIIDVLFLPIVVT